MNPDGMRLASAPGVPFVRPGSLVLTAALLLVPGPREPAFRSAAADPLWQIELRGGYGVALSGSGDQMTMRATPLTVEAVASFAFNDTPPLAGYAGLIAETLDRNAMGTVFGVTLSPGGGRVRLSGGGVWIAAPYTLWGATASLGACLGATSHMRLCGDLRLTSYFAGSDLGDGRVVNEGQVVAGVAFDAL
jgi:hypothetical protein